MHPPHWRNGRDAIPIRVARGAIGSSIRPMTLLLAMLLLFLPVFDAKAKDSSSETLGIAGQTAAKQQTDISISLDQATLVVTASSGYHLKATIANPSNKAIAAGSLELLTNISYTFVSRTDMQGWAQGQAHIDVPDLLGNVDLQSIPAKSKASVTIDVPTDNDRLKAMVNWGPKPILLRYGTSAGSVASVRSFLTRSNDGLPTGNTPAMKLTVVMPLSSSEWQMDDASMQTLISGKSHVSGKDEIVDPLSIPNKSRTNQAMARVLAIHNKVQVIADPLYQKALDAPIPVAGIIQPGVFDITTYAAKNQPMAYDQAGVSKDAWSAKTATAEERAILGDSLAKPNTYAWQGGGNWTVDALQSAREQGYSTVISNRSFDDTDTTTVHTGKYVVPTSAGNVTVLSGQQTLSSLAQGRASSRKAVGEGSQAGRLARFIAQSAFYQMELPYNDRNLLVCLNASMSAEQLDAFMTAVEQASWLNLIDLNGLSSADAYRSGKEALALLKNGSGIKDSQMTTVDSTLQELASSRSNLARFASSIMTKTSKTSNGSDNERRDNDEGDAQSLAKQDAKANRPKNGDEWIGRLRQTQSKAALLALGDKEGARERMSAAAQTIGDQLLNGVSITPTDKVSVVSETAQMPVTVSNKHPYPVSVRVSSRTNSAEIVTSRFEQIEVPAGGEAQTTFTIRVSTSGSAQASLTLQDRTGNDFSLPQTTTITSALQLSDKSGFVFIAIAFLLGVLGLWRQFHRKKDPDE